MISVSNKTKMTEFYESARQLQVIPIFGSFVVSPIVGTISAVHAIIGLAGAILFGNLHQIMRNSGSFNLADRSIVNMGEGILNLSFSALNFITIGIWSITVYYINPQISQAT